jgi:hypothetical protein
MSTRIKKKSNVVLYPLIAQAAEHADDDQWKTKFQEMAKGNPPKRLVIDAQNVKFFSKKDGFTYTYSTKTPQDIARDLKNLISKAICMYTEKDLKQQNDLKTEESKEYKSACKLDDWKKVKNKKMKDLLISNYVIQKQAELEMDWSVAKKLYQTINTAFYDYHTHKSADIEMSNGQIESIEDIVVEKTRVYNARIYIENEDGKMELSDEYLNESNVVKKRDLYNDWTKYVTFINKRFEGVEEAESESESEDEA